MTDIRDSLAQVVNLCEDIRSAARSGDMNAYGRLMTKLSIDAFNLFDRHGPALLAVVEGDGDGR